MSDNQSTQNLLKEVENLKNEIKQLKSRKRYGLVWEDKPEQAVELCRDKLPILVEDTSREINTEKEKPVNILIEGDNYHALSVLNYTHQNKIDVIYVDPPYNTGARDWKYNNDYVDAEDAYRHTKWLSFMAHRLKIAKNLLKNDGVFVLTIDDYEIFPVGLLLDDIFGEQNRIGILAIEVNPRGRTTNKFFATSHEYVLFYAKNAELAEIHNLPLTDEQITAFNFEDTVSKYRLLPFRRSGGLSTPEERPNSYYPIYYNEKTGYIGIEKKQGCVEILPVDSSGKKRVWRQTRPSLMEAVGRGDMVIKKTKTGYTILMKDRIKEGRKQKTIWINPLFDASSHGTVLLQKILGKRKSFDYPKSLYAVIKTLSVLLPKKKNALILDFFAGSGTTGHAVMSMNNDDGGNRKFILCTNNENNIATEVCYPRISKVIEGYKNKNGEDIVGLGGNLKYFKTDFIDAKPTDKNKKKLVDKSTEMLCLKEDCFEEIKKNEDFKIFKNNEGKYLSIIYDDAGIEPFKKMVEKLNKNFVVYVFSLDDSAREEEFEDIKDLVELKPIPAVILNVYKRIFK